MDERVVQARVGIVVISALILTAILIVLFGDVPSMFHSGKIIRVRFINAPGVAKGTPVRKSGILVGRVSKVEFIKNSPDVLVTLNLHAGTQIYENEICKINNSSLLGDAFIEFVPGIKTAQKLIPNGAEIKGLSSRNPLEMLSGLENDLQRTLHSLSSASDQFGKLGQQLNKMVTDQDEEQFHRIINKSEQTLDSIHTTMNKVNHILGDEAMQDKLKKGLDEIPEIVEQTRDTLTEIQIAVRHADRNLQNLEGLTGPLGEHGADIVNRLDSSLEQFDDVMNQFHIFTNRLNSQDGTIGQLMNNPSLYNNLNRAALNIERVATQLQPIMGDIRVFSDKIARDPAQLGLAGALHHKRDRTKYPNFEISEEPPMTWRDDLRPPANWRTEPLEPTPVYPY
jgi:phospholipid/cholesterol/gamma-HCH transport system substrate-binding protein